MSVIWKFPFEVLDVQTVKMPKDARILTVQIQHGICVMWAICEPATRWVQRKIHVVGTGHLAPVGVNYIATIQDPIGLLVWHIFDGGEE